MFSYLSILTRLSSFHQSLEEVAEVAAVEAVEAAVVLEAEDRWEWEGFSKEVCQNYAQLEVKSFWFMYFSCDYLKWSVLYVLCNGCIMMRPYRLCK